MTHLFDRLSGAKQQLEPVQSDYRVVFEDDIDGAAKVLVPDPNWMAAAMHGGILPPVEVYHDLDIDAEGRVTNGHILHDTPPIGPMTEEEAIEYLVKKDVPPSVWSETRSNARKFIICKKDQLPQARTWRNAWAIQKEAA